MTVRFGRELVLEPDGSISNSEFRDYRYSRSYGTNSRSNPRDLRTETERDKDRLAYSYSVQRLMGITQISSPALDHPERHSRLLHSLKVSWLARELALDLTRRARDDEDLSSAIWSMGGLDVAACETAGLAHDVGHCPFGHGAERFLDSWVRSAGGESNDGFEGNAQTMRILLRHEKRNSSEAISLTNCSLAAVMKYPRVRGGGVEKFGVYSEDENEFSVLGVMRGIRPEIIRPDVPSLEAQLMDLADDITYAVHDLQDYYQSGLIDFYKLGREISLAISAIDETAGTTVAQGARLGGVAGFLLEDVSKSDVHQMDKKAYANALTSISNWMHWDVGFTGTYDDRGRVREAFAKQIGRFAETVTIRAVGSDEYRVEMDVKRHNQLYLLKTIGRILVVDSARIAMHENAQISVIDNLCQGLLGLVNRLATGEPERLYRLPPQLAALLPSTSLAVADDLGRRRAVVDYLCTLTDAQCVQISRWLGGVEIPEV